MSQAERDSWDLRRWQEIMADTEPQVGKHMADPDAHWRKRAEHAAYHAGLSPERLVALLRQHLPDDPQVALLYGGKFAEEPK